MPAEGFEPPTYGLQNAYCATARAQLRTQLQSENPRKIGVVVRMRRYAKPTKTRLIILKLLTGAAPIAVFMQYARRLKCRARRCKGLRLLTCPVFIRIGPVAGTCASSRAKSCRGSGPPPDGRASPARHAMARAHTQSLRASATLVAHRCPRGGPRLQRSQSFCWFSQCRLSLGAKADCVGRT